MGIIFCLAAIVLLLAWTAWGKKDYATWDMAPEEETIEELFRETTRGQKRNMKITMKSGEVISAVKWLKRISRRMPKMMDTDGKIINHDDNLWVFYKENGTKGVDEYITLVQGRLSEREKELIKTITDGIKEETKRLTEKDNT